MLGTVLILLGVALASGSIISGYYFVSTQCAIQDTCQDGFIKLLSGMMIADEGIFFWLAWVIAVFLIWGGIRLRA